MGNEPIANTGKRVSLIPFQDHKKGHMSGRYTKPTKPVVQRDPRTSLYFKKIYVIGVLILILLTMLTLTGWYVTDCQTYHASTDTTWIGANTYFFYIGIPLSVLWGIATLIMMIRWKWAWMTITFMPPKKYGEDVEDLDPGILSRSGTAMALDANKWADKARREAELALIDSL